MALRDALTQFNTLVNTLSHASGKGVHEILQKKLMNPHYDVVDKEEEILLNVNFNNISIHPVNLIEVNIQSLSVEVKVRDLADTDHFLKISRLHEEIDVNKSKYEIVKDSIRMTLVKLKRGKWHCLHYHHPDVFKNFKDKVKAAKKHIPIIKHLNLNLLLNHQQMCSLEIFAMCGMDIFEIFLAIPAIYKTIEQIIEDLKTESKEAYDSIGIVCHLFTFLLTKERKDYEDSHPEALKFYEKKEEKKEKKKTQNEKKAETLKLNGNQFVKKKEYFEAIQSYTEAIDLDPQCPIYYLNRAIAYYNICFYVLALEDTAKALSINPFYCKAYYYLGETLLHDCFPDDALKAFQRALILDPLNRKIEDKITETYEFRHHFLMFIECIRHCDERETLDMVMRREKHLKGILKVMDSSVAAERLFKHLCDKGMIAEAKIEAVKLSTLHNYDKNSKLYFLAICSFYEDDEEKFRDYFKQYKATENPILTNIESRYQLCDSIADIYDNRSKGDEMFKKGSYKKAIELYLKAQNNTDIIPLLSSKLLLKIGLAKRELKDKSSFLYFHESLKLKNDNHEALAARGECLLQEGKFELALKDFVRAEKIFPCRRYAELIVKAKEKPEDNAAASDQEKSINSKQVSESRRKAVKKKEEGNKFFQNEDFRGAIKCYTEAIEIDNSDDVFFSNRAVCYINLRKFDDAVKDCEKALELNPSSAKSHFRLGQCYLAKGEINEAVSSLEKALKVKPKDVIVQKELQSAKDVIKNIDEGNKLFDDKRYEEAGKMFSSILEITTSAFNIYNKCMECYMRLGRFQDAINAGDSIFYPYGNFQYYYLLGICYLHERMLYYAHRCFKDALERDPVNETLKSVLEYLSEKREYFDLPDNKTSEEIVQKILSKLSNTFGSFSTESDHDLAKNKRTEGDSYFEKKQYRDALHCYTEALSIVPLNCSLYVSRASCYFKLKKFKDAISEIKEALDIDGKCSEAFKLLGNIETIMGNTEKAKSAFKEAENLCPQNEIDLGLVKVLKLESILEEADRARDSGGLKKVIDLYKEALEISPASHCIYEKYGECHLQLKNYTCFPFEDIYHGLEEWDEFQLGTKHYLEGRLYYLYGDGISSINYLEDAVQFNPSNEKYKKWLNTARSVFGFIDKTMGALTQNDMQSSLNYLNEAIQMSEDSPFLSSKIYYYIGFVKCKQKKLDEAIEWFTKSRDILLENTDFHAPYTEYNEEIWRIPSKFMGEDRKKRSVPMFKERKFQETVKIIRQTLVSSLEKRAYCYKLQGDYRNALRDYMELYNYTAENEYRSIAEVLSRSKKV